VKCIEDLYGIEILFIPNDHFWLNLKIWKNVNFIDCCNNKNIDVIVFTNEQVNSVYHPWNVDIQKELLKIKKLHQYMVDVDDTKIYNTKLSRSLISKYYENYIEKTSNKLQKCVFIGSWDGYPNQNETIKFYKKCSGHRYI